MAWNKTMVTMLRVLINDTDSDNYSYTDKRLQQILVVSAHFVQQEVNLTTTYTINIDVPNISPDPTVSSTLDPAYTNLTVLKAACTADWSTFRTKALVAGVEARCGAAVLRTLKHIDGFKELLESGPCAAYETLKTQHQFGDTRVVKAILSPFIGNNFDPQSLPTGRGHSTNFGNTSIYPDSFSHGHGFGHHTHRH